jgi:hypothetical protein
LRNSPTPPSWYWRKYLAKVARAIWQSLCICPWGKSHGLEIQNLHFLPGTRMRMVLSFPVQQFYLFLAEIYSYHDAQKINYKY